MPSSPKKTSTSTLMQPPPPPQTAGTVPPPNPNSNGPRRVGLGLALACAFFLLIGAIGINIKRFSPSNPTSVATDPREDDEVVRPTKPLPPLPLPPTATLTLTLTPLTQAKNDSLLVLCASNAVDQYKHSFSLSAYESLSRYATTDKDVPHPDINRIMKGLYVSGSVKLISCSDPGKMLRTQSASQINSINTVRFNVPNSSRIKKYWILMTARDTATVNSSMLDPIGAIYSECIDNSGILTTPPARELRLGDDIADWTFRGIQVGDSENHTIAYLRSTAKDVRRVFIGYDIGSAQAPSNSLQTTDNRISGIPLRAAQMFAVPIDLEECKGQLKSITIEDTSNQVGLDILAAVLVPDGFPDPVSAPKITHEEPICLLGGSSTPDVDNRGLYKDIQEIPGLEPVKTGCDTPSYNTFHEIAPNVHFTFTRILATYPDTGVSSGISPKITLNTTNTITATHLYLLLSARNMCVSSSLGSGITVIGQIKINGGLPLSLRIGDNIRQGRTNLVPSDKRCSSGASVLYMNPANQQQDNPKIAGYPGIPLRAKRNDRVHVEAELWLDLIKIPLPKGSTNIRIEIENALGQVDTDEKPFITLYAATLVTEEP
jgi:hypothetical protein